MNELLLNPFSPFDTKCKKLNLMRKTFGNVFLNNELVIVYPKNHGSNLTGSDQKRVK